MTVSVAATVAVTVIEVAADAVVAAVHCNVVVVAMVTA